MTKKKPTLKAAKKADPKPELSIAERMRLRETKNAMEKLNAGKTLTAYERKLITDHDEKINGKPAEPKPEADADDHRNATGLIEVTETDIIRFGLSRQRVKAVLATITPVRANRHQRLYDLGQVVLALLGQHETDDDRKKRLDADLSEEKLRRLRGESIDLRMARDILADIMRMLVEAVKAFPDMTEKSRQALLKSMRSNTTRLLDDLATCRFTDPATEMDE